MPQAIHESLSFNSRNRKVAIHCVFSVKDNTHSRQSVFVLFRSEETVAGIAEAGEDVSLVVEATV